MLSSKNLDFIEALTSLPRRQAGERPIKKINKIKNCRSDKKLSCTTVIFYKKRNK
jgi:hypothetical protein